MMNRNVNSIKTTKLTELRLNKNENILKPALPGGVEADASTWSPNLSLTS